MLAACSKDLATTSAPSTSSWLFVVDAGSASLTTDAGDASAGTLTMRGLDPDVLAFTDRPARAIAHVTNEVFAGMWPDLFGQDPPNAVVTWVAADGSRVETTATISALTFDGTAFSVQLDALGDASLASDASITNPEIFIDDAILVPTEAEAWSYHAIVASEPAGRYVAKAKLSSDVLGSTDDLIYSFPAASLVEQYSNEHLRIMANGVHLYGTAPIDAP